eukprot:TRINITY_DN43721_c0_g1_i1.p2 TRINITY_DN43721_c0_g1~~TRINITY_DN43721_c0_g1_i1.p2  ORF type:complete len:415 (+),score=199.95 TRINITY_DN43721_c0_g1_i1:68-1312(+)
MVKYEEFGSQLPGTEPAWYQGIPTPYYTADHVAYRAKVRDFVETRLKPNVDEWIKTGYPLDLHVEAVQKGVLRRPKSLGGSDEWDSFYELIMLDEMARTGGGYVLGQLGIDSMALPPIVNYGTPKQKALIVQDVLDGKKHICLAISEPGAGSDVSNIQTRAVDKGDHYEVTGFKKWITGGMFGDYFTTLVRTGGQGMGGLSLLMIDKNLPGISIRKMETQFDSSHHTTFITFDKVPVPKDMLIGRENHAFRYIMYNFNHERFVIACQTGRASRVCYEEAFRYAMQRKTFGKRLIEHQIIRFKLAEMLRQIEAQHDSVEKAAFAFSSGIPDHALGVQCALLKVNGTKVLEYCAREASQIFGGSAVVREGKGKIVERLYRDVRSNAIPGGSEEVLLDFAIRQAAAKGKGLMEQGKL